MIHVHGNISPSWFTFKRLHFDSVKDKNFILKMNFLARNMHLCLKFTSLGKSKMRVQNSTVLRDLIPRMHFSGTDSTPDKMRIFYSSSVSSFSAAMQACLCVHFIVHHGQSG